MTRMRKSNMTPPAFASEMAWVYAGATPDLSLEDAAAAIRTLTLDWTAQDHLDEAVVQHCYADSLKDAPKKQAVCAAAAFMHFAAADVDPMTTGLTKGRMARAPIEPSDWQALKSLSARTLTPRVPRTPKQIGVTRSAKPIFDVHDHPAHKDFDAADHMDAVRALGRHLDRRVTQAKIKK